MGKPRSLTIIHTKPINKTQPNLHNNHYDTEYPIMFGSGISHLDFYLIYKFIYNCYILIMIDGIDNIIYIYIYGISYRRDLGFQSFRVCFGFMSFSFIANSILLDVVWGCWLGEWAIVWRREGLCRDYLLIILLFNDVGHIFLEDCFLWE